MYQLNNDLPEGREDIKSAGEANFEGKPDLRLLNKVRQNFGIFAGIALIFAVFFALWFYKAAIGVNVLIFSVIIILLLLTIINKLKLPLKKGTMAYYLGVVLLGISTMLTSSSILHFLNLVGIMFLLDLSLLHQFQENGEWGFVKHLARFLALPFYAIGSIGMPFIDGFHFLKKSKAFKNEKLLNIILGLCISVPILLIITALLSGADLLFGRMTEKIVRFSFSTDILAVGFMIIFGFFACYCVLCGVLIKAYKEEEKSGQKVDASIAITVVTLLCLVYAIFCGLQIVYLFANGLFVLPQDFTFAEYARRGFFELLAVTAINIIIMLLCGTFFQESKVLRLLLTFMTVCTYIMIASAAYRMLLYIDAYHLTFLRLFVLLALLIDAFILGGIIIAEYNKKFPLFPYSVLVISVCYIAFSFARPDYYIASYLLEQKELLYAEDVIFLTTELSPDAASVVVPLLADSKRWTKEAQPGKDDNLYGEYSHEVMQYIMHYYNRIENGNDIRGFRDFNLSYYNAGKYTKKYPLWSIKQ